MNTPNDTPPKSNEATVTKESHSILKKVLSIIVILIILAAIIFALTQRGASRQSSDYKINKINNLETDQQKKVLEDQLKDYQQRAANLAANASRSNRYTVYIRMAELQNRLGQYQDAIASLGKIVNENQGNNRVWLVYTESYKGVGDKQKALDSVHKALAVDDEAPEAWTLYLDISKDLPHNELNALYFQALAKTNNNIDILTDFARSLEKRGDKPGAISMWQKAGEVDTAHKADYDAEINRLKQ